MMINFPLTDEVLDYLELIHRNTKNGISLERKDKELAIYIITGRVLTHCRATTNLLLNGFYGEAGIVIRSIYETLFLITYFDISDSINDDLAKWFDDKVIKPKKARKKHSEALRELLKPLGMAGILDHDYDESIEEIYRIASKYTHPTYNISKINMNRLGLNFDYKGEKIRSTYGKLPYSFEHTIIFAINTICSSRKTYKLDNVAYEKLRKYVLLLSKGDIKV